MLQTWAELLERRQNGTAFEIMVRAEELSARCRPGQPVLMRTGWGLDPYLRRTLYPTAIGPNVLEFRLPAGGDRGLAWLRMAPVGSQIDCLGPIGRGYEFPKSGRRLLIIGESEQAWSLMPAVAEAARQGASVVVGMQFRNKRYAIPASRFPLAVEYRLATLDGSLGIKGSLEAILPDLISWCDGIFAAGSLTFYSRLRTLIQEHRLVVGRQFAQVLYPAHFFCGSGACLACATDIAGGRRRVCLRGPVFDLIDLYRT